MPLVRLGLAATGIIAGAYIIAGPRAPAPPASTVPTAQASWRAAMSPTLPGGPAPVPVSSVPQQVLQAALGAGTAAAGVDAGAPPSRPAWWTPTIGAAAQKSGLPAALLAAVVQVESEGNPRAVSPAGAKGLMQLLPTTAAALGVRDIFDPLDNASGGARYLKQWLMDYAHGDTQCAADPAACPAALQLALAAYNAGPGAVRRYGGVPPYPETQRYIREVLALYAQYRGQG